MLIKVRCKASQRGELRDLADVFHGTIADVGPNTITVEIQGKEAKMASLQQLLAPYGEIAKSHRPIPQSHVPLLPAWGRNRYLFQGTR